jgi:hypothetical protein
MRNTAGMSATWITPVARPGSAPPVAARSRHARMATCAALDYISIFLVLFKYEK